MSTLCQTRSPGVPFLQCFPDQISAHNHRVATKTTISCIQKSTGSPERTCARHRSSKCKLAATQDPYKPSRACSTGPLRPNKSESSPDMPPCASGCPCNRNSTAVVSALGQTGWSRGAAGAGPSRVNHSALGLCHAAGLVAMGPPDVPARILLPL